MSDRGLVNVRFGPPCGLNSDISLGPRRAEKRHAQQLQLNSRTGQTVRIVGPNFWCVILNLCTAPNLRVCDLLRGSNQEWVLRDGGATAPVRLFLCLSNEDAPIDRN